MIRILHILPHTPTPSSYSSSEVFFGRGGGRLGGRYVKVTFREYTDNTFTIRKLGAPDSEHLGILGKASLIHQVAGLSGKLTSCLSLTFSQYCWLQCSPFVQVQS